MELGYRDGNNRGTMSQINVTPLVDVMLVLLIIFMVTAPMMQQGMQVNLPKAQAKALPAPEESVTVSIERTGRVFINSEEIPVDDLRSRLDGIFTGKSRKEIFLKADREVPYGEVVKTMAVIKRAGIERLGMVTEPSAK
jgi:biopolymer transport protein TolR